MNKRVNDIRRCILAFCFFGLILSLIGSELPWVQITQSEAQNPIYVTSAASCNATLNNGSLPDVSELKFTLDVYMTLASSQVCQLFISGRLPSYIGGAVLKDIRMCADLDFDQVSNFMLDVKKWDDYASACGSSGGGTFFFIIVALILMAATMLINTFPSLVRRCCEDMNATRNKVLRSVLAFCGPLCVTFALIIYSTGCVNGDLGDVLTKRGMDRTGSGGYWICCISCALLWVYWALFIFRMCDNEVDIRGAGDIKARFLRKGHRDESDVDAGMMDEAQEQREAFMGGGGGAYTDNAYREPVAEESIDNRKATISAYDDDGIEKGGYVGGVGGHQPSAGSWKDVEED